LTEDHPIAADSSVLVIWKDIPDDGKEKERNERMMIQRYSDTEYMIHHPVRDYGI